MIGRVVRLRRGGACGFIRTRDGSDVFFHASDLHGMVFGDLEGEIAVQFTLVPDSISGPRAVDVRRQRVTAPLRRV